jgi:hypothetical protein
MSDYYWDVSVWPLGEIPRGPLISWQFRTQEEAEAFADKLRKSIKDKVRVTFTKPQ